MDKETYIKEMLSVIYDCKEPFTLKLTDKNTTRVLGSYQPARKKIIIHKEHPSHPIEEVAIHEYAHHIHFTEFMKRTGRRPSGKDRPHGEVFWRIYTALMCSAIRKGLLSEPLKETAEIFPIFKK